MKKSVIALAIAGMFSAASASAAQPTLEQKLEVLQQEIEALKAQIARSEARQAAAPAPAAASPQGSDGRTTIGGYGEAVYNNYRDGSVKDQADLKRFVLFFGHKFTDRTRLFSELEVEHSKAGDGEPGEVAMEQAFIEHRLTDRANFRAGLMLMPLGTINETHEPTTFYGVERNEIESRIIPSTWRELGIALQGEATPGLEYNVGISTTPDATKYKDASKGFRDMRTNGAKAAANDLGVFGALNYRGVPGLLVGGGLFVGNTAQDGNGNAAKAALANANARLTLWDVHAKYTVGDLDLQALYARGTFSDTDKINAAAGLAAGSNKAAPKSFYGWYGQAAYHVYRKGDIDLAPFVRYERYDTQHEVDAGYTRDPNNNETVTTVGLNLNLNPHVVLKADYQNYKTDNRKDRFNLGVGYMF